MLGETTYYNYMEKDRFTVVKASILLTYSLYILLYIITITISVEELNTLFV